MNSCIARRGLTCAVFIAGALLVQVTTAKAAPTPEPSPSIFGSVDTRVVGQAIAPTLARDVPEIGLAACQGDLVKLRDLISSGVGIERSGEDKRTPLLLAAAGGHAQAVAVLLEAGSDVNAAERSGDTTLHWAAQRGDDKVVMLLVAHHAKVNLQNRLGETPLILAAEFGNTAVVKALLDSGADPKILDKTGRSAQSWAHINEHPDTVSLLDRASK